MGVAAGIVSLLLFVLGGVVSFGPGAHDWSPILDRVISVVIKQEEAEPTSELETVDQSKPRVARESEAVAEMASAPQEPPNSMPNDSLSVQRPPIDWPNATTETVAALAIEKRDRENVRQTMWRQTRSVMFQQTDDFDPNEQRPVLANLHFKPEIHVLGLGVRIGSCFVGLPLVGVPVEERTVAIRLFVCANDSG